MIGEWLNVAVSCIASLLLVIMAAAQVSVIFAATSLITLLLLASALVSLWSIDKLGLSEGLKDEAVLKTRDATGSRAIASITVASGMYVLILCIAYLSQRLNTIQAVSGTVIGVILFAAYSTASFFTLRRHGIAKTQCSKFEGIQQLCFAAISFFIFVGSASLIASPVANWWVLTSFCLLVAIAQTALGVVNLRLALSASLAQAGDDEETYRYLK